jgi:hypothetical protein
MRNGLKQGCPLSPILFNLALDPLLTQLRSAGLAEERAYCDDIAIGSTRLSKIAETLPYIDHFNQASGAQTNLEKVALVSTRLVDPLELEDAGFTDAWCQSIEIAESAKYLGVPFGRDVSIDDVFMGALKKFSERVAAYMPLKGLYSVQQRVIIANSFLLPTISYLQHYFVMSKQQTHQVERMVSSWVVPAHRYTYNHLTAPSRLAGLSQPLKDAYGQLGGTPASKR